MVFVKLYHYNLNKTNYFDIVFSIGVIHHLENPKLAVFKMCQSLKSNGIITLWVYGYENNEWIVNYFNPLRNLIFKSNHLISERFTRKQY